MSPLAKLAAYGAIVVVVFAVGIGFGRAVGPIEVGDDGPARPADVDRSPADHGHGS